MNDKFLNKLERKLDKKQEEALKVNKNAVIAAGAGSGKTQVLATRFAWLIMTGQAKVDEILTLTFTNKAAAEMYQRIYQTLNMFAYSEKCEEITEENISLAKEALNNFSNAHIQTLDSYCGGIVRQSANKYGIKPDFTTGSEDCKRNIKSKAFKFVLANKDNIGIQTFAKPGNLQDFAEKTLAVAIEKYTSLATEDNYFKNKLSIQLSEVINAWNYYILGITTSENLSYLNSKYKSLPSVIELLSSELNDITVNANQRKYADEIEKLIKLVNDFLDFPEITENDILTSSPDVKNKISQLKFIIKDVEKISSNFTSGYIQRIRTIITDLKNIQAVLYKSIISFINNYDAILSLNTLFDDFLHEINSSKRTSGNLSFTDISDLAIKILLEQEDVRNQEKNSFKKIMIDEFQDNNSNNRDLLYILSLKKGAFEDNGKCKIIVNEKKSLINQIIVRDKNGKIIEDKRDDNKLFFVGDEKQSIYKFRGADVSVFNELTKDTEENQMISMTYNYRSKPELLQAFNLLFKNGNCIFDSYNSEKEKKDFEAYYDNNALKNENGNEKVLPKLTAENVPIHFNFLENFSKTNDETKKELYISEKEQIAFVMAKKLSEMGKENKNWSDFAILERSRTDSGIITKYLNMFNIPYTVDQFTNIFDEAIINDFYNFLRLCVYPSDINSYAAYLTSPFCGLSVNAVELILSHLIEYADETGQSVSEIENITVENAIKADLDKLDNKSYKKYFAGRSFYKENKSLVLQQQITSTLSYLWNNKGYKYESFLSEKTQLIAEHFDMFFELGRQAESSGKTISWFVDQLAILKKDSFMEEADIDLKDISYPYERSNSVRIMTIHKSKGLEFPHVFIYGCVDAKSKADKTNVFYNEKTGITIKPDGDDKNYFSLIGEDKFKEEEAAEFKRLIYVAITRAEESVNVFGSWTSHPKNDSDSLLRLLENATRKYYNDVVIEENGKNTFFNSKDENVAFDYTYITPTEYCNLNNNSEETEKSIDSLREIIKKNTSDIYKNADIIKFESNPIPRKTPSSLEPSLEEQENAELHVKESGKYKIDSILSPSFRANDFGTMAHAYLEAQANNISPEEYEPDAQILKLLDPSHLNKAKKICTDMCKDFKASELGIALDKAKASGSFYRAEWGFRMKYDNSIYSGSIDLIYSNGNGKYTIVDYKTDKNIEPEIYAAQQHCYRTAAANLLNVKEEDISLYLYYLRHDKVLFLE